MRHLRTRRRESARWLRSLVVNRARANEPGPKVLANSIPKAGTHLLTRCLTLMPGITDSGLRLRGRVHDQNLEARLRRVGGGCFMPAHVYYTEQREQILSDLGFQIVLIIRDPRDIVVSHYHYVTYGSRRHQLRHYYRSLPDDAARLMTSITGIQEPPSDAGIRLPDIDSRYRSFLAWANHGACVVRFEHMVGPRGGGSDETQRVEILKIAEHLGVQLEKTDIQHIASNMFHRGSTTFRKGIIGDWKRHLTPEHRAAFKQIAGQLLVDLGYEPDQNW